MVTIERENLAWHVAGHACAAIIWDFQVHKLALDGFSDADLADREGAQRLDKYTMLRFPHPSSPAGWFQHTIMERLMYIAVAGPVAELQHRQLPCVLENVVDFTDDWKQAWHASGFLRSDETQRLELLARNVQSSYAVVIYDRWNFYSKVVAQLTEQGRMSGEEVHAAFDQMLAADEARDNRVERPRKRYRYPDKAEVYDGPRFAP